MAVVTEYFANFITSAFARANVWIFSSQKGSLPADPFLLFRFIESNVTTYLREQALGSVSREAIKQHMGTVSGEQGARRVGSEAEGTTPDLTLTPTLTLTVTSTLTRTNPNPHPHSRRRSPGSRRIAGHFLFKPCISYSYSSFSNTTSNTTCQYHGILFKKPTNTRVLYR